MNEARAITNLPRKEAMMATLRSLDGATSTRLQIEARESLRSVDHPLITELLQLNELERLRLWMAISYQAAPPEPKVIRKVVLAHLAETTDEWTFCREIADLYAIRLIDVQKTLLYLLDRRVITCATTHIIRNDHSFPMAVVKLDPLLQYLKG